jgi:hypothetical protein
MPVIFSSEKVQPESGLIVREFRCAPKRRRELVQAMNMVCRSRSDAKLVVMGQETRQKAEGDGYKGRE